MFIQQPVRITARPLAQQSGGVMIDTLLRMHYTAKTKRLANPKTSVLRLEVMNPVLVGNNTQVDLLLSVETSSIDDFNEFLRSFANRETTDDFEILTVG